jgi:transposase
LGLKPIERSLWWPKGIRPIAHQRRRYQWLHLFAFVRPSNGDSDFLISPNVNTAAMNIALEQFAEYVKPDNNKIIVLLVDRAGWHTTGELTLPEGIRLFALPPYTPELMPTECAWPPLREPLANRPINDLDELEAILIERCRFFMENRSLFKQHVGHQWVIEAEEAVRRD